MNLEEMAINAKNDESLKNYLIRDYQNFILSSASRTLKRRVTEEDDEFITAMLAFSEAIDSYDADRGRFISFASAVIHNRLIDGIRQDSKYTDIPFSALETENGNGDMREVEIPVSDDYGLKWEIDALTEELSKIGISFFDLARATPKSRKTKRCCRDAINLITGNSKLAASVISGHILPIKEITESAGISRKTVERHRKYIMAAIIVLTQDYPLLSEYFRSGEVQI